MLFLLGVAKNVVLPMTVSIKLAGQKCMTPTGGDKRVTYTYTHSDFSAKNLRKSPTSKLGCRGEGND